jgi:hypothetical protein
MTTPLHGILLGAIALLVALRAMAATAGGTDGEALEALAREIARRRKASTA